MIKQGYSWKLGWMNTVVQLKMEKFISLPLFSISVLIFTTLILSSIVFSPISTSYMNFHGHIPTSWKILTILLMSYLLCLLPLTPENWSFNLFLYIVTFLFNYFFVIYVIYYSFWFIFTFSEFTLKCILPLFCCIRTYPFLPEEGSCFVISTRYNCCAFLASDDFYFQRVH